MFTGLLSARRAQVLATDLFEARLKMARHFGAKWVLRAHDEDLPEKVARLTRGVGFDAAVVCAPSNEAVWQAQELIRGAGKVLLFAHTLRGNKMELDLSKICVEEKDLIGSYSADITLQREVAGWVFSRRLDVRHLITHQFPLRLASQAIQKAAHRSEEHTS